MKKVTIIGAGNIGMAVASYLSNKKYDVTLLTSNKEVINSFENDNSVTVSGLMSFETMIKNVTDDKEAALKDTEVVIITTPALYHESIAISISNYLENNSLIVLFSGKFAGSILIESIIKEKKPKYFGSVIEATSVFSARKLNYHHVRIRGIKNLVRYASVSYEQTKASEEILTDMFPSLAPVNCFLERSFCDIGSMLHPAISLLNLTKIETGTEFKFYLNGATQKVVDLIEILDHERISIAKSYNVTVPTLRQIIFEYYGSEGDNLYEVIHNTIPYQESVAPVSLDHRYLIEDVSESLLPMYELALQAGVNVPVMKSIIDLTMFICDYDFYLKGRTLSKLGINKCEALVK
jgi:opine dehydrogenase